MTGTDQDLLARRLEAERPRLRALALRMLGSAAEAEDAVQDAWLRLARADVEAVGNLSGWLTTTVGRLCLDALRARRSRREDPIDPAIDPRSDPRAPEPAAPPVPGPEEADAVGVALLVVLDTLGPAERVAFVLHDVFGLPFDEVALVVGRTPTAARQLASRARRRVRGAGPSPADRDRRAEAVAAFLAASQGGDLGRLVALLDPDVVFRADPAAVALGGPAEARGAEAVAGFFRGRATGAQLALLDGAPGLVVRGADRPRLVLRFRVGGTGRITEVEAVADEDRLARMEVQPVPRAALGESEARAPSDR